MHKFIRQCLFFSLPIAAYCLGAMFFMPTLLSVTNGPSTKQQITQSFENALKRDYQLLVLGNSRTYRGIDPDAFFVKTFNFSHDNDSYNQIYHKLYFLLSKNKRIDYLVLGTDYFMFSFKTDTRNYAYADFLGYEYTKDFSDSKYYSYKTKMDYYLSNINPKNLLSLKPKANKPFLKENGQYIKHGKATLNDHIDRDIDRLTFQETYFRKVLDLCIKNDIKTFVIMLPTRPNELKSYLKEDMDKFDEYIKKNETHKNIFYLNYSNNKNFTMEDYTDITHFNENAAKRFSSLLNSDIDSLIKASN